MKVQAQPTKKRIQASGATCYALVASEYYDAHRHPTCANFRLASALYIREKLLDLVLTGRVLDVGAGLSIITELFIEKNRPLGDLTLVDGSIEMIAHSAGFIRSGVGAVVGDATSLPFRSRAISLIVA